MIRGFPADSDTNEEAMMTHLRPPDHQVVYGERIFQTLEGLKSDYQIKQVFGIHTLSDRAGDITRLKAKCKELELRESLALVLLSTDAPWLSKGQTEAFVSFEHADG